MLVTNRSLVSLGGIEHASVKRREAIKPMRFVWTFNVCTH